MKCRQLLKYLALKFVKKQYSMNAFDLKKTIWRNNIQTPVMIVATDKKINWWNISVSLKCIHEKLC